MSIVPGARLGPYEILTRLGSGGMGVVYRARDSRLERQVAIKVLPPDVTRDLSAKKRFLHEARAASALDHVNICTIHEINETDDGQLYLVMSYYDGETLAQRIQRGPIELREAIGIVLQVGRGLAEAHAAGIVHRDIKPANLLVTKSGVVKILDFGLAKLMDADVVTQTGVISGTVAYMSPEQVLGQPLDQRTDVWALGVVLYEMLAGHRPFQGDNLLAISHAIAEKEPDAIAARRDIPPEIETTVFRALAKHPIERYQNVTDLLAALGGELSAATGTTSATVSGTTTRTARVAPSIAVLAFADMSPEKDQDYFCEGVAEELINALTAIEGVRVAARTSSFQFKGQGVDVGEIGRRLRVGTILEGSVRKAGNRLRITAQLISASDGYHLWSERYDRDMDDVFAVQDEIARSVVAKLRIKLLADTEAPLIKRHTTNLEAYHAFLRGRHYRFSLYDLRRAIEFFEQAVQHDPSYALAHAAIADCFNILGLYSVLPPQAAASRAKAAAERALQIDDSLAEAHATLAQSRFLFDWDWAEADRGFKRALELKPAGIETYCWYGYFLATLGRATEGLALVQRASEIDPLSAYVSSYAAVILYIDRRFDEAVAKAQEALELQPAFGVALNSLAFSYSALGRYDDALPYAEKVVEVSNRSSHSLGTLGSILALARRRDAALAFEHLEKAYRERTPMMHSLRFPNSDALRADPRWNDLVVRMHFPTPERVSAAGPS